MALSRRRKRDKKTFSKPLVFISNPALAPLSLNRPSAVFFYFDLQHYLTLQALKTYHLTLIQWTTEHLALAVCLYLISFTLLIAATIPCGTLFTLVGGFLFGKIAIVLSMFSTTVGGLLLYYAVRSSIGPHLSHKSAGWINNLKYAFQENAFYYLLMLRLLPVCPCWICNISSGALNVPLNTFLAATLIGITPATIIYVFTRTEHGQNYYNRYPLYYPHDKPLCLFSSLGISFLSLFPVIYKSVKKHRRKR